MASPDPALLEQFRRFLETTMYALVDFRVSFEAPIGPTGFPRYEQLQAVVARLDRSTRTIFRLFRLGECVADSDVREAIPPALLAGLAGEGLVRRTAADEWRTPDLLLIPIEGVFLFVGTPQAYPTASRPPDVWFDLSSHVLARSLPAALQGARVLDLCCGSGLLGILCMRRGAGLSVGLDISEASVRIATINAALNGGQGSMEFRQSDRLAALDEAERFDFVICNTPHAPTVADMREDGEPDLALERIGNIVLVDMIDTIPAHLNPSGGGMLAIWRAAGQAGRTAQHDYLASRLAAHSLGTRVFAERAPDTAQGVIKILTADAERRFGPERSRVLADRAAAAFVRGAIDGFYNQVIAIGSDAWHSDGTDRFGLDLSLAEMTT